MSLIGQYWIPHSVNECSPRLTASAANRYPVTSIVPMKMKKKTDVTMSAMAFPRGENLAYSTSTRTCWSSRYA